MKETGSVSSVVRICPMCGKSYREHPALSRLDNTTEICPDCGVREALASIGGIESDEAERILAIVKEHRFGKELTCTRNQEGPPIRSQGQKAGKELKMNTKL